MATVSTAGDPRFFAQAGNHTLAQVAAAIGAEVPAGFEALDLTGVAPLQTACATQISFLDNRKYISALAASAAGAVIVHPDMIGHMPTGCAPLITRDPYAGWAAAAALFHPLPPAEPGAHPTAVVHASARIDPTAEICAHAVIGANVEIGAYCSVGPGTFIAAGVTMGAHTRIGAHSTISHAIIGSRVFIFPGARIGQEGFGFATVMRPTGPQHITVPQLGRVLIEDDVEIGANTTIDRGSAQDTVIGAGSRLDNLVQIAHNVRIGRACVVVAQVGISGSTVLEDFVVLAGQVGVAGHLRIGRGARIGGKAGVMTDVPPGVEWVGTPAEPAKNFFRNLSTLRKIVAERAADRAVKINNPDPGASPTGPAGKAGSD